VIDSGSEGADKGDEIVVAGTL